MFRPKNSHWCPIRRDYMYDKNILNSIQSIAIARTYPKNPVMVAIGNQTRLKVKERKREV